MKKEKRKDNVCRENRTRAISGCSFCSIAGEKQYGRIIRLRAMNFPDFSDAFFG